MKYIHFRSDLVLLLKLPCASSLVEMTFCRTFILPRCVNWSARTNTTSRCRAVQLGHVEFEVSECFVETNLIYIYLATNGILWWIRYQFGGGIRICIINSKWITLHWWYTINMMWLSNIRWGGRQLNNVNRSYFWHVSTLTVIRYQWYNGQTVV